MLTTMLITIGKWDDSPRPASNVARQAAQRQAEGFDQPDHGAHHDQQDAEIRIRLPIIQ